MCSFFTVLMRVSCAAFIGWKYRDQVPPPPRPVINFPTNLLSSHHAGCEESTFTHIHVPFIATARATPGT